MSQGIIIAIAIGRASLRPPTKSSVDLHRQSQGKRCRARIHSACRCHSRQICSLGCLGLCLRQLLLLLLLITIISIFLVVVLQLILGLLAPLIVGIRGLLLAVLRAIRVLVLVSTFTSIIAVATIGIHTIVEEIGMSTPWYCYQKRWTMPADSSSSLSYCWPSNLNLHILCRLSSQAQRQQRCSLKWCCFDYCCCCRHCRQGDDRRNAKPRRYAVS